MKVILINGSPRKNGCTNRALKEVQAQLSKEGVDSEIFLDRHQCSRLLGLL